MIFKPLYKNFIIVLAADLLLLTGALYAAHLIRFDFDVPPYFLASFYRMLPYVLIAKIACFYFKHYSSFAPLNKGLRSTIFFSFYFFTRDSDDHIFQQLLRTRN